MTSQQINQGMMNQLLALPKNKWPKEISEHIEEMVETERQRRFEMILDVPPFQLLSLIRNRRLPWM